MKIIYALKFTMVNLFTAIFVASILISIIYTMRYVFFSKGLLPASDFFSLNILIQFWNELGIFLLPLSFIYFFVTSFFVEDANIRKNNVFVAFVNNIKSYVMFYFRKK